MQPPGATWQYQQGTDPAGVNADWLTTTTPALLNVGNAPFGNTSGGDFGAATTWSVNTHMYLRRTLDLTGYDLASVMYDLGVDNGFDLYVNGNHVAGGNAEGFTFRWEYSGAIPQADLVPGNNIIAVVLEDHGGLTAFDMQIRANAIETGVPDAGTTAALLTCAAVTFSLWRPKR